MPRTRMAVSVSRLDAGNKGKAPVFCEVSGSEDLREHQNLKPQRTRRTAAENAETQGNPEAELSATSSTSLTAHFVLPQKLCVRFRRRLQLAPPQKSRIRRLVENLLQRCAHDGGYAADEFFESRFEMHHACSSVAKRVATNGDSRRTGCLRPASTRIHTVADSTRIAPTSRIRMPVTRASRRSLKMRRAVAGAATFAPDASRRAWARKPMRG